MQNVMLHLIHHYALVNVALMAILSLAVTKNLNVSAKFFSNSKIFSFISGQNLNLILVTYLPTTETPCAKNPCGVNAVCKELNTAGSCSCIPNYYGDPYIACRPECMTNSECSMNKACINTKCQDPCPGICGNNALCNVVNHSPACSCVQGFRGNPYDSCTRIPESKKLELKLVAVSDSFIFI